MDRARQDAKREKSLNKIPAMQRVAMELAKEAASSSPTVTQIEDSVEVSGAWEPESEATVGFATTTDALSPFKSLFSNARHTLKNGIQEDLVSLLPLNFE